MQPHRNCELPPAKMQTEAGLGKCFLDLSITDDKIFARVAFQSLLKMKKNRREYVEASPRRIVDHYQPARDSA